MHTDTNYTWIAADELADWRASGRDFTLLDVMPGEVYSARRIPGAVNACVYEVTFFEQVAQAGIAPESVVVVYGEDGQTHDARSAAEKLVRMGHTTVYALRGGIAGWIDEGRSVEGSGELPEDHQPHPPEGTYEVDTEQSVILWTGRNAAGSHSGTLSLSKSGFRIFDGKLGGEFFIDLKSLKNTDLEDPSLAQTLVDHLLSDDFFFADRWPEVAFKVEDSELLPRVTPGGTNCHLRGELALRGTGEVLAFPAILSAIEGGVAAEAHFDMDRTRWGAIYGSGKFFRRLGMHLVHDNVSIQLRIVGRRK